MDGAGITITEACAKRAELGSGVLTDEDFTRQCNPDGTVKQAGSTTELTLKNTDYSVTVNNTYLYLGIAVFVVAVVAVIWTVKKVKKTT